MATRDCAVFDSYRKLGKHALWRQDGCTQVAARNR